MNRNCLIACRWIVFACFILTMSNSGRAELILDITSTQISARTRSYLDVFISSRDGTPINIAGFDFTFAIFNVSPAAEPASGELFFLDSFDPAKPTDVDRQSNSEQLLDNYVFSNGRSSAANFAATRQNPDITRIAVGDSTLAAALTDIPVSSRRLLARIEIGQRQSPDTVLERGRYEMRLIGGEFFNADFEPVAFHSTVAPGSITISAVPEPSSIVMVGLWSVFAVNFRRKRNQE